MYETPPSTFDTFVARERTVKALAAMAQWAIIAAIFIYVFPMNMRPPSGAAVIGLSMWLVAILYPGRSLLWRVFSVAIGALWVVLSVCLWSF